MSAALSVFKLSVQSVCQLQQHNSWRSLAVFRNDRIALSMNSCDKSFHIDSKVVFSLAMLVGFSEYSFSVFHPHMTIQWIEIWQIKYQGGYFKLRIAV